MSDRVDFAVAKNDFNICRFRVVSVDPEKYAGPIYHYSWLPYAWLQSHHSPFGKADNFIISFQGYKHAPSTETINIEKESIVTTWILNPWVPPLSYYNAWPTKKVNSFSKTYFAEWTRPVSLDPGFMPDGSMGGQETRFAIVSGNKKHGPVAAHRVNPMSASTPLPRTRFTTLASF